MTAKRQWVLITAVACLLVLVAGYLLLVRPQHSKAATVRTDTAAENSQVGSLRAQLAQLQEKSRDLAGEQAVLSRIAAQLPPTPQLPSTLRALDKAADQAKVELVNVAPGVPVTFTATAITPSTSASPAAGATPTPTPTAAAATAAIPGLAQVPLVLTVSGGYFQIEAFLNNIEGLQRSMLVDTFTLTYGGTTNSGSAPVVGIGPMSATISTRVFESTAALGAAPATGSSASAAATS